MRNLQRAAGKASGRELENIEKEHHDEHLVHIVAGKITASL